MNLTSSLSVQRLFCFFIACVYIHGLFIWPFISMSRLIYSQKFWFISPLSHCIFKSPWIRHCEVIGKQNTPRYSKAPPPYTGRPKAGTAFGRQVARQTDKTDTQLSDSLQLWSERLSFDPLALMVVSLCIVTSRTIAPVFTEKDLSPVELTLHLLCKQRREASPGREELRPVQRWKWSQYDVGYACVKVTMRKRSKRLSTDIW